MPQETNLNVNPYFDDFDKNKNFYKVLFKPGTPVQARELSTLQSILQNQIEQFGTHFFKEGSKVIPGNLTYDPNYQCVQIEDTFLGIPVEIYADQLKGLRIVGDRSGVTASIKQVLIAEDSIKGNLTLYLKYEKSGAEDFAQETFFDGESLLTTQDLVYGSSVIGANEPFANTLSFASSATGSAMSVGEGVYFVRGQFVQVLNQTLILDQYDNEPSYRVGFDVKENFITADEDASLMDNASGYTNYAAPGADRLKIEVTLTKKNLDDLNDQNFIEIARIENGDLQTFVRETQYNLIRDTLASRTYDESGNYYVKPFSVHMKESLNDNIGNKGVYTSQQKTQQGGTPSDDLMVLQVSPGKAFVKGYDIEKISTSFIDVPKPRTTKHVEARSIAYETGDPLFVNNVYGSPALGIGTTATVQLLNARRGSTVGTNPVGESVGIARIYDFKSQSASYSNQSTNYEIRLFDVKTFTKIIVGTAITFVAASDRITGSRSGASGYVYSQGMGVNQTNLTLVDVSGAFIKDEAIIINGVNDGRIIKKIDNYGFNNVKSLRSYVGVSTFEADLLLDDGDPFIDGNMQLVWGAGNTGTISADSKCFVGLITANNIISYTVPGKGLPTFNRVTGVANDGFSVSVAGIVTVPNVADGGVPTGTTTLSNVLIRKPTFQLGQNSLLTPLTDDNIESLDVTTTTVQFRKQYDEINVANNQFTSPHAGDDMFFQPFDEERYLITYDDGTIEPLKASQCIFATDKKTVTFVGLSKASGKANLYATVLKATVNNKLKKLNSANVLVVNRSTDEGSGIGTNTKNDGLTFSRAYGTRVQDEEISLNLPDCVEMVGVYESNDNGNPDLPSITLTAYGGPSGNNTDFIIGEKVTGLNSDAVALFAERPDTTTIGIVFLNDNRFTLGETLLTEKSGITATVANTTAGDKNLTNQYLLDTNAKSTYYDFSFISRKQGYQAPTNRLKIVFKNFYIDADDNGDFYSASSYPAGTLDLVPFNSDYETKDSDLIDIRPRVNAYNVGVSTLSPFEFGSREFATNNVPDPLVPDEAIIASYNYYLPRIDRLFLSKQGDWLYSEGVPSDEPGVPAMIGDALPVATVNMPAYVSNIKEVMVETTPHKRFTMADIGRLEDRLKTVEYYTRLSLLELDTASMQVTDANGFDRFKSGFFVDNFKSHDSHQIAHPDFSVSIDKEEGHLRPGHYTTSLDLVVGSMSYIGIGTTADPTVDISEATDIDGQNIRRNGPLLTLDYEEVPMFKQVYASRVENVNPFLIVYYAGDMTINPDSDTWMDTKRLAPNKVVNSEAYDKALAKYNINPNTGLGPMEWGSWKTDWTGTSVLGTREKTTKQYFKKIHPKSLPKGINKKGIKHKAGGRMTKKLNGKWVGKGKGWITNAKITTTQKWQDTQTTTHKSREGVQMKVTYTENTWSQGDRVLSTDRVPYMRKRNIEFDANRMKPRTKFFVFFDNVNVTKFCTPKLIEIRMTKGVFQVGETVTQRGGEPADGLLRARVCQANHKKGPYNKPTEVLTLNPYDNDAGVPASYSTSSKILNIDTRSLANMSDNYAGNVQVGMKLIGRKSKAQAKVTKVRLITDALGNLKGCFNIPDSNSPSYPQFECGTKTLRLSTSETNSTVEGTVTSSAEANYYASGQLQTVQETIMTVRVPQIQHMNKTEKKIIQGMITSTKVGKAKTKIKGVQWYDPLAQTIRVEEETGIYVTSCDVFLRDKDTEIPLNMQIRTVQTGLPTSKILPFSVVVKDPKDVNVSEDASIATNFKFDAPVFLSGKQEFAIVLVTPSENYTCWISRMGEVDISTKNLPDNEQVIISQQPYLGSLFKSQNGTTWDPSQYEDMKFTMYKAKFNTNPGVCRFYNPHLSEANNQIPKLVPNSIQSLSRRAVVGLGSTFAPQAGCKPGCTITQAGNLKAYAKLVNTAGIATINGSNDMSVINPGVGYTPSSGVFTYKDVPMVTSTGDGSGAIGNVTVQNGVVGVVTLTNGGKNFALGDSLGVGTLGLGNGSGAVISVGLITSTNTVILDEIQGKFNVGLGTINFNNGSADIGLDGKTVGSGSSAASFDINATNDGLHFRVAHHNHAMNAFNNVVVISDVQSDIPPTELSSDYDWDSTNDIQVKDSSNFATFEGVGVGTTNFGYAIINDEIISYTGVGNGKITGITTRGVDGTATADHDVENKIAKYEYSGVSLRRINKKHDMNDPAPTVPNGKGFDFYHIKVDMGDSGANRGNGSPLSERYFNKTKVGGGERINATQNIEFETLTTNIETMVPPGTNIGARLRTVSGTSIDGNETSFNDEGYEAIDLDEMNHFDSTRLIASRTNELNKLQDLPGNKSLTLEMNMVTDDENLSPCIDLDRVNAILTTNRINNPISSFPTDRRVNITGQDPCDATYVSKLIKLDNPATRITLEFAGNRTADSDFRALYKVISEGSTENSMNRNWELFPGYENLDQDGLVINESDDSGHPDEKVDPSVSGEFKEYVFNTAELPPFTKFQIKLIMVGTNAAHPPRIKELRAIAVA